MSPALLEELRARTPAMLAALDALVSCESPTAEVAATARCGEVLAALATDLVGRAPERVTTDGATALRWSWGEPRVLLLGHLDTVWPLGTLARWPFAVDGDRATGPGAFDMKAGLVQGLFALAALDDLDGVALLVTADEETGSPTSRHMVEEAARGLEAVLVLEPSAGGALKSARKGVSTYRLEVTGRAAHAGLEPERGVNALTELAALVTAVAALGEGATSVTPTVAAAGTTSNVVPAAAWCAVDVRAVSVVEQDRIDAALHALAPRHPGAGLVVRGGPNRPPLEPAASAALVALARAVAADLGLGALRDVAVGGGSDGNLTAGVGTRTLDGLGAVGDGAHAEGEHVLVAALPERAALVAELVRRCLATPAMSEDAPRGWGADGLDRKARSADPC